MPELITYGSTLTGRISSESNENGQGGNEAPKALAEKGPGKQHEEPDPPAPAPRDSAATTERTTRRPRPQPPLPAQITHAQKYKTELHGPSVEEQPWHSLCASL